VDLATTERIRPLAAAGASIRPRVTAARRTGIVGLFLFREIINQGGLYNSTASVNRLTEAVLVIASVKTMINHDLLSEAVAKTASVNHFCPLQ
jgi:hypothetical protein